MKLINILLAVFLSSFLIVQPVIGATRYVRPNGATYGTSSGDDYVNAYTGGNTVNWGALSGGDVVYVVGGGGTYTNWLISDQTLGSSGNPVIIKRATIADHGTETGWSDSFDAPISVPNGYIAFIRCHFFTLSGVTSNGISIECPDGSAGFSLQDTTGSETPCNGVTVEYMTINGGVGTTDGTQGMFLEVTNFVGRYLILHSFYDDAIRTPLFKDSVIEYTTITNKLNSPTDLHGDAVEMIPGTSDQGVNNAVFGHNYINWSGDGFQLSAIGGQPGPQNVIIHNSVLSGMTAGAKAIKANSSNPVIGPISIFNVTFTDGNIRLMPATTSLLTNNIFYGVSLPTYDGTTTHNYNAYSGSNVYGEANGVALLSADPFVNSAGGNYIPAAGSQIVGTGFNLGSTYATDFAGVSRIVPWDIGAYTIAGVLFQNQAPTKPIRLFKR